MVLSPPTGSRHTSRHTTKKQRLASETRQHKHRPPVDTRFAQAICADTWPAAVGRNTSNTPRGPDEQNGVNGVNAPYYY
jgi:hypothetical protein